eukprot:m.275686 g.275686  ORF g.275686 m.275686 type:complete len:203 (-) comp54853_c0_seq26:232-840(-)
MSSTAELLRQTLALSFRSSPRKVCDRCLSSHHGDELTSRCNRRLRGRPSSRPAPPPLLRELSCIHLRMSCRWILGKALINLICTRVQRTQRYFLFSKLSTILHWLMFCSVRQSQHDTSDAGAASVSAPTSNPADWSAQDVVDWLTSIGMQAYCESFFKNSITGSCLQVGLDDSTLDFLEVRLPVHRRNLVRRAAALFTNDDA